MHQLFLTSQVLEMVDAVTVQGFGIWLLLLPLILTSRCCVVALLVEDTEATWRTWTCTFRAVLRNFSCSIRNHGSAVETPAKAIPNAQC